MFRFGDPGGRLYNTAGAGNVNMLSWWNGANFTVSQFSVQSGGGRTTGSSLRHGPSNGATQRGISIGLGSQPTWGIAFALKINTNLPGNDYPIFSLIDIATLQIDLRVAPDGTLKVTRNGTALGSTTISLLLNTYTHIEWLSTINNSTGSTQIWINGVLALSLTNQNTRNTANNSASVVMLVSNLTITSANSSVYDFDDIIVYDGQTIDAQGNPDIHSQIGDCGLVWLLPTGAGTTTQFTPDSGSNYTRVNEATPDGDTSYVEDPTVGHIDTYTLADLPGTVGSVKSVAVVSYARKTDFSSRGMKHELRTNSTNVVHTNEIALGNSYTYYMSTWGQNPTGTPANWTVADINALEIGRQVSS